ncbi:part of a binding-protein-dependent transport system [Arthrobacter sp. Hiyo4]|nr:part of a binding-protein-dependent transport system [Arthrobacter sp. Hiyo4]
MTSNNSHFVAPIDETPLLATDTVRTDQAPLSLWADAWRKLRRRPLFIISALLILALAVVALFPAFFRPSLRTTAAYWPTRKAAPRTGIPSGSPSRAATSIPALSTEPRLRFQWVCSPCSASWLLV